MLPYMANLPVQKNVIKLKILRGGTYPGYSGWILKASINILIRERRQIHRRQDDVKTR